MAIKGKGKARARRTVAAGPRPTYVVPTKPFLARRSVQFTALGLILAIIGVILFVTWNNQREADRLDAERVVVRQFAFRVEEPVRTVSQALPPTGLAVFGELRSGLTGLREETVDPTQVARSADGLAEVAETAAASIEKIPASTWARDRNLPLELLDAKDLVVSSMELYRQAATTLGLAVETEPGDQRDALLDVTESLLDQADQLFARGYQKLVNERLRLQIQEPQAFEPGFGEPTG